MTNEEERQRIKDRQKGYRTDEIEVIQAVEPISLRSTDATLRVCAYCRVSTDNLEQASSFELQRIYYEEYIQKHPNWILVDIYSDEGISGTSLKHRDGFKKMIKDCKEGKIDLIITKAVARFSRNVVDCIDTIRQLKNLNPPVRVFFETENIDTADNTSDVMLNLLSIFAQEESHTKSEIMNWSIENRFARGNFLTPELFGYTTDIDKPDRYTIVEDEAEIIRLVFSMYITGYSPAEICDAMTRLKYKSNKKGECKWTPGVVNNILNNERRAGMIIARKTYTPDYTTHRAVQNVNQRKKFKMTTHHDPIVSLEVYYRALDIKKARRHRNFDVVPTLSVIKEGALKGFVPVSINYYGFTIDNYKFASEFAYEKDADGNYDNGIKKAIDKRKISKFDLSGFEKVGSQLMTNINLPMCWFKSDKMYFNRACIDRMNDTQYIELLFEPNEKLLAIRSCDETNPYAIKWGNEKNDKVSPSAKSSAGFSNILFEHMEWNKAYRYRMIGVKRSKGNQSIVLFDLNDSEALYREDIEFDESDDVYTRLVSMIDEYYIEHFGNDFYQDIYSMRLYLIDQLKKWNIDVSEIPIEEESTSWLADAKNMVQKHLNKLNKVEETI